VQRIDADDVLGLLAFGELADDTEEICAEDVTKGIEEGSPTGTLDVDIRDILEEAPVLVEPSLRTPVGDPDEPESALTVEIAQDRVGPRRFQRLVAMVMGGCLSLIVAAAIVHASAEPGGVPDSAATTPVAVPQAPASASASASAKPPMPHVEVQVSGSGTILAPAARSIAIDGKRLHATSAIVPCGSHSVRVNGRPARMIFVPCGRTVMLDGSGSAAR
jgi:hypothetical protein